MHQVGEGEDVRRFAAFIHQHPGIGHLRQTAEEVAQPGGGGGQIIAAIRAALQHAEGQFLCRGHRQSADAGCESLVERHIARAGQGSKQAFRGDVRRVELVLGGWRQIGEARLHLADAAHVLADVAGRIQDAVLSVHQDQVGVTAHDFQNQPAQHMVAHLVHGVNVDVNDAVAADLADGRHAPGGQLLAQQHAEHRRFEGVGEILAGKVEARVVGRGAQEQLVIGGTGADEQDDGVLFRLGDLPGRETEGEAVHGHGGASFRGE